MAEDFRKMYNHSELADGSYLLEAYLTSSESVEMQDGKTLEEYKEDVKEQIDGKGDGLGYDVDEGEVYLYSGDTKISTSEMVVKTTPNIELNDIEHLSVRLSNKRTRLTWDDPDDVEYAGITLAEWAGTKVVRKVGSAPNSVSDGTLILNNTVRNQYSTTPYYDNTIQGNTYYYYRFFSYDTDENYTGKTVCVVYYENPLEEVLVPVLSGTYTYNGSIQTSVWTNYDSTKMTMSGDNTGTNAGTYSVTFSLQEGYMWNDGTTADKTLTWTIEPESLTIPSLQGTYTYTGNTITPIWNNYNPSKMSISGDTSGVNAGDYSVVFSLSSNNYKWSDSTVEDKTIVWNIGKANGNASLSKNSVTIKKDVADTVIISNATGVISVVSNDTTICTAFLSNNVITITGVDSGNTSIAVNIDASMNYTAATKTIEVIVEAEKDNWVAKAWSGLTNFQGQYVWTDGSNIYFSQNAAQYVLNESNSTWSTKTWSGLTSIDGQFIWTDGDNIYYDAKVSSSYYHYILDKSTSTWRSNTWTGFNLVNGYYIWSDGNNIYYSSGSKYQYVLDKSTSTWTAKTWSGLKDIHGCYIWSDDDTIYYSQNGTQYVLNKETSTWSIKSWSGLTNFSGEYIWSDGNNIYYSYVNTTYILNKSTSTWTIKTWNGYNNVDGLRMWKGTDDNVYYSNGSYQYVLT